jgi:homoserine dehydrogenase
MASPLRVAIAGLGTVGGGVANLLSTNAALIASRTTGRGVELVAIADQRPHDDLKQEFGPSLGNSQYFADAVDMARSGCADVVVETIGGYGIALQVGEEALRSGASLVTANKALLAVHGENLAVMAEGTGASIGWEAAVGGGIPCIKVLREGLAGNNVRYAAGILNGTCNFILTTMKETGRDFDDVLAEAQSLGYAETPPDLDVDGIDTAHKISLVAAVATGCKPAFDSVHVEGIRAISGADVSLADKLGFSIKLLGIVSTESDGTVKQRVHPALIPVTAALGATNGVLNGLFSVGDFVGPVFSQGPGAGRDATASACVADILDIARGNHVPTFGMPFGDLDTMVTSGMESREGRYFVRCASGEEGGVRNALQDSSVEVEISAELDGSVGFITGSVAENIIMSTIGDRASMIRVEGPW